MDGTVDHGPSTELTIDPALIEPILINVRYGAGTHTATAKGTKNRASATSCMEDAVDRLAQKIARGQGYELKRVTTYTWILTRKHI
jgi:hypothetical protein